MAQRVRWGILGTAAIARQQFAPAVRASERGVVHAVASRDAARGRALAAALGAPVAHTGYAALLADPEVDAVYIALPNSLHARWVIAAARAGKHVLCEKPLAADASEALAAVRACEAARVVHCEAFVYRYHPQTLQLTELLRSGAIGAVRTAHASFHFVLPPEERERNIRMRADLAGGALMDVGCYPISWLRLVFGEEPLAATAQAVWDGQRGVDTQMVGLLHFSGGRAASFACSFDIPAGVGARVSGTQGEITVSAPYHPRGPEATLTLARPGQAPEVIRAAADEPPFLAALTHFHACVLDGVPPLLTARDGVANMAAIEAVARSARAGGRTEPVLFPRES